MSARPGILAQEAGMVLCMWRRELLRVRKERARWIGALAQPLLFWLIIGGGLSKSFRIPGAEHVGSLQYFFPGMLVMVLLFTSIFATISVVEDRQQGFLQSVLVAPGTRLAMVAGKVLGVTTLAVVQVVFFLMVAPLAGFPLHGVRWALLAAVSLLACIGLTAMNFTFAWLLNSVQAYHAIMGVLLIPLWFLSGAMFPPPGGFLGALMMLNPLTHAVDGLRQALAPDSLGVHGLPVPWLLLILVAYACAMLLVAAWSCRRREAR
jgi:daunorubicin resistance ABC transporter membrane protein